MFNIFPNWQGFKNANAKEESGGKKGFYDKSDHKGYHSKYDHFDSFHESTSGGSKEGKSHKVRLNHKNVFNITVLFTTLLTFVFDFVD